MYSRGGFPSKTCFVVAVAIVAAGAGGCRTRPAEDPQAAKSDAITCDAAPAVSLDVLEDACVDDPACSCEWLGLALLETIEPEAQRRGINMLNRACASRAAFACELYESYKANCLKKPEQSACEYYRGHGELPDLFPIAQTFGCHRSRGWLDFKGLSVVVCLAEDRISVRDTDGRWDQWRVQNWRHEDTPEQAIVVADGVDGPSIFLTPVVESGETYAFATGDGRLQVMLEAKRAKKKDDPPFATKHE